ncbi:pre-mRNA-processing protein 40A-like isoform X1 [Telopea speciosissima]|uniref:pre-mRNA-processing protein 40A-like isoform X1 n=1 Tax=Telopea speciosissima TaxID=54955 RepID=UPI001CC7E4F3|nr:pre-mRNA-processing protein 40A-like isoform X1 [Telopea speciosissima]
MANNPQSSAAQPLRPPPIVGSAGPPQNFAPSMSMQFRPMMPAQQQGQPFMSAGSQQFRPVGQGVHMSNVGMQHTAQGQQLQYSQPTQQLPPRPGQPGHGMPPSSQAIPMPFTFSSVSPQPQQNVQPMANPMSGVAGSIGIPLSSGYTFTQSSYGQLQSNVNPSNQYQPISQMHAPNIPTSAGGQPWLTSAGQSVPLVTPVQQTAQQQPVVTAASVLATNAQPDSSQQSASDWQEHTSADGRRYYYNKKTRQSSWEKPLELMTPIERADASTVWKEFTTPEGRKYYYNKVTKQSKWTIPDELRSAREQAEKTASQGLQSDANVASNSSSSVAVTSAEPPSAVGISISSSSTVATSGVASSPVPVTPIVSLNPLPVVTSGSPAISAIPSGATSNVVGIPSPAAAVTPLQSTFSGGAGAPLDLVNATTPTTNLENVSQGIATSMDGASVQDLEEAKKGMAGAGKINVTPMEEKTVDDEPLVYATKQEAKNAFKAVLESVNVESDWTWEQTMRIIINDKRYGALKTLGERKQAFNEYLGQRKKQEAEERRIRQKKAREEFTKMLEESEELTSSTRWSKVISMFEDDERFKAVERARDREDLFENYLVELQKKERAKAQEEQKRNIMEFRQFLESCDFIKANSQWRKVQDRLEDDERCSRLEKIDRLEIFQEYIRDLEKEEEEQKKIQKEQQRRIERKNRDEFRKLLEGHVADGMLTAKTRWRDYFMKVKDLPAYIAVSSNASGSTPKDLFEDVVEELEKQYHEDKTRIKDGMKLGKINIASSWALEDFKASITEVVVSHAVSDINLKLIFEELIERIKEKEEKEAKKRQRLADDFTDLLHSIKEITASSEWEESKSIFEDSQEYRAIGEENFRREIFEEYVTRLQEKAKERERKREEEKAKKEKEREEKEKRKEKERKEKERERERDKGKERSKKNETENEIVDITDNYVSKEEKKREKDKDRKHRKRHHNTADDVSSEKDEKEEPKKSRRHSSDRKKSRKHAYSPETDSESRHKRHKRDHRDSSRRNGGYEELEDGELGEDGEIRSRGYTRNDD